MANHRQWVPFTEAKPKEPGEYWITCVSGLVQLVNVPYNNLFIAAMGVAWMPADIPEPYVEGDTK